MSRERSPGIKLLMAGLVAGVLIIPLLMVYALVWDRENQSERAQAQITQGWGGAQVVTGPLLVIPFTDETVTTETVDGVVQERRQQVRRELFVSPAAQSVRTNIDPDRKRYAIYESIVYQSRMAGTARFVLTDELARLDVEPGQLLLDQAQLRFGVSDPRGLTDSAEVLVNGDPAVLRPGDGPAATNRTGFSAQVEWSGEEPLEVAWEYGLRGSRSLSLVPRGGETEWQVTSPWPHPSFTGGFLPDDSEITGDGFTATYPGITNLALGSGLLALQDGESIVDAAVYEASLSSSAVSRDGQIPVATIGLTDPVDLYSQVDRAVKYGFLFIGFTFAVFLMFDIVGGAKVATAEYLLTGAGLVLFFVLLLAFAEVIGFAAAYIVAAAAIIGLLTAYSAAVLGTWKRASFIGAMLAGLYAMLYVLLNSETFSLVFGSLMLFAALAGIMYGTRNVDWSGGRGTDEGDSAYA